MSFETVDPPPLFLADGLGHPRLAGAPLSFSIRPGLTLVLGGDGRGKTTLLRLIAGEEAAASGRVSRAAQTVFFADPGDPASRECITRDWIDGWRARCPAWDAARASALTEAFGLTPHVDKPLFMLSTGSRRKAGLVAAAASGADLTLLDTPFAALDLPSRQRLRALLDEAVADRHRAWVVADYTAPDGLADGPAAARIDLGD